MDRRNFMRFAAVVAVSVTGRANGQAGNVIALSERLAAIRQQYGFPGIAAAAVRGNAGVAEGGAGGRRGGGGGKNRGGRECGGLAGMTKSRRMIALPWRLARRR